MGGAQPGAERRETGLQQAGSARSCFDEAVHARHDRVAGMTMPPARRGSICGLPLVGMRHWRGSVPERGSPAFWWGRASPTRSGFLASPSRAALPSLRCRLLLRIEVGVEGPRPGRARTIAFILFSVTPVSEGAPTLVSSSQRTRRRQLRPQYLGPATGWIEPEMMRPSPHPISLAPAARLQPRFGARIRRG